MSMDLCKCRVCQRSFWYGDRPDGERVGYDRFLCGPICDGIEAGRKSQASKVEHLEAELANWRALHEGLQKQLEEQLLSLGWQYGPGRGLRAGIDWAADEIRRLRAERELLVGSENYDRS